jgi:hypothetical protein
MSATVRWLGLALLGILIAAAISIAASRLASQQIGLASQPISAGDALAPAAKTPEPRHSPPGKRRSGNPPSTGVHATPESTPQPAPSSPASPAPLPPAHVDDSGGSGGGDQGGGGADD